MINTYLPSTESWDNDLPSRVRQALRVPSIKSWESLPSGARLSRDFIRIENNDYSNSLHRAGVLPLHAA